MEKEDTQLLNQNVFRSSARVLSVLAIAAAAATASWAQTVRDSSEVSRFLSEVKTEAVQLRHDADELKSFTRSSLTWQSHAAKVEEIKAHINKAGELLTKLENTKGTASPWQQQAIERITPMLKELASNTESTIDHLNQRPKLLHTGPYKEYVDANYEVASSLEELISDYVDYGKSKARSEELASKLEVPER
jgi:hypothetical protein